MKRARAVSPFALLVGAVALAYANALVASFQFDDWNVIVGDPRVRSIAAWWESMPGIRPLLKLSYAINWTLSSGPAGFHLVNVAIHAANACLVHAILARRVAAPVALTTALIFALHPVQTEAVTYASGRSVSLSALFALACLATTGWVSGLLLACGLMVRESVVAAAVVKRGLAPFLAAAAFLVAALLSADYLHLFGTSFAARSVGANLLTQAHAVVYLMGQLVRLDRLNADPALPVITSWSVATAAEAMLILALIATGVALWTRQRQVAAALLWFFLWLLPTNSIVPRLDVANDRQLYLALLGPAFLAARALGTLGAKRGGVFPVAATALLLVLLGGATHLRNRVYADEVGFWDDVAAKAPHNARAFNNLGYVLALDGRTEEAEAALRRALAIDPSDVRAASNLKLLRDGALPQSPSRRW